MQKSSDQSVRSNYLRYFLAIHVPGFHAVCPERAVFVCHSVPIQVGFPVGLATICGALDEGQAPQDGLRYAHPHDTRKNLDEALIRNRISLAERLERGPSLDGKTAIFYMLPFARSRTCKRRENSAGGRRLRSSIFRRLDADAPAFLSTFVDPVTW